MIMARWGEDYVIFFFHCRFCLRPLFFDWVTSIINMIDTFFVVALKDQLDTNFKF